MGPTRPCVEPERLCWGGVTFVMSERSPPSDFYMPFSFLRSSSCGGPKGTPAAFVSVVARGPLPFPIDRPGRGPRTRGPEVRTLPRPRAHGANQGRGFRQAASWVPAPPFFPKSRGTHRPPWVTTGSTDGGGGGFYESIDSRAVARPGWCSFQQPFWPPEAGPPPGGC